MRFQMSTFQLHEQGAKWTWSPQNGGNFHTKIILRKIKFYPCCEGYGSGFETRTATQGGWDIQSTEQSKKPCMA